MDKMNTYRYNADMADTCTRIASFYKKNENGYLATFYANAAKGFKMRSLNTTFEKCKSDENSYSLWNNSNS